MKIPVLQIVAILLVAQSVQAQKLNKGSRFPDVTLSLVATGEPTEFKTLVGEKLMLHLFASW